MCGLSFLGLFEPGRFCVQARWLLVETSNFIADRGVGARYSAVTKDKPWVKFGRLNDPYDPGQHICVDFLADTED